MLLNYNFTSVIVQIIVALRLKIGREGDRRGRKKSKESSPAPMPACSDACYAGEEFGNRSKDFFIEFYILENDRLFVWPLSQGQVIENFKQGRT